MADKRMNTFTQAAEVEYVYAEDTNGNQVKIKKNDLIAGGNLAASNIRNLECPSYEVYLIDYGCGKFNKKVHIME